MEHISVKILYFGRLFAQRSGQSPSPCLIIILSGIGVNPVETGWYYCKSRYYDPSLKRFISSDALMSTGQGLLGLNMYAYCLNNPVNRADASGNKSVSNQEAELGRWIGMAEKGIAYYESREWDASKAKKGLKKMQREQNALHSARLTSGDFDFDSYTFSANKNTLTFYLTPGGRPDDPTTSRTSSPTVLIYTFVYRPHATYLFDRFNGSDFSGLWLDTIIEVLGIPVVGYAKGIADELHNEDRKIRGQLFRIANNTTGGTVIVTGGYNTPKFEMASINAYPWKEWY